jgi:exonuclease V
MATWPNPLLTAQLTSEYGSNVETPAATALSDYGSDTGFEDIDEDTILADVLQTIQSVKPAKKSRILPSIEFEEGEREDEDHVVDSFVQIHQPALLRVAKSKTEGADPVDTQRDFQNFPIRQQEALEVKYDERSRRVWSGTSTSKDMKAC